MPLIKDGRVTTDAWTFVADDAPAKDPADVIVSLVRLERDAGRLYDRKGRLGVRLAADDDVAALAPHLKLLDLVALEFPKFSDGRAFSKARLLRERYGFSGELRAVGDVLRDQLFYMVRCGFDAFEIAREDAGEAFVAAMRELRVVYQPASDDRRPAWIKRLAKIAAAAE